MTEKLTQTPNNTRSDQEQRLVDFGPTPDDVRGTREMLRIVKDPETRAQELGKYFSPRVYGENTALMLDAHELVISLAPHEGDNGLDQVSRLKLAYQRYIAGVLGLQVSATEIHPRAWTATTRVDLPDPSNLPSLPVRRRENGNFILPSGREIEGEAADAIFAAHYIDENRQTFSQPGAFETLFRGVVAQAEAGEIRVASDKGNSPGALAIHREVARVLGYEVGSFGKQEDGSWVMQVQGIKPGFDDKYTPIKTALAAEKAQQKTV